MAAEMIISQLPEPLQRVVNTYYAPYKSYLNPFITRTFFFTQSIFFRYLWPTGYAIYSIINRFSAGNTSDMTIQTLFMTALLGVLGLWVMNFLRKRIFSFVYSLISMAVYLLFWVVIITIGLSAYYRGFQQTADDVLHLAGLFLDAEKTGQKKGARKASSREWEAQRTRRW